MRIQRPPQQDLKVTSSAQASAETTAAADTAKDTVERVDFPDFVAGLIGGTFQAVVDASIQQMDAYADLVQGVSKSVDEFARDDVSESRDHLVLTPPDDDDD